jgi:hypothetical protein
MATDDRSSPLEGVVETDGETEIQVVDESAGVEEETAEEKPEEEKIQLSKEEYAKLLKGGADPGLGAHFEKLGEQIRGPRPAGEQAPAPAARVRRSDEEVEADIFVPGRTRKVLRDEAEAVLEERLAPIQAQYLGEIVKLNRTNLIRDEDKGPLFKRYEKEIEELVQGIPAGNRVPDIYDRAYTKVIADHAAEIQKGGAADAIAAGVSKALEDLGLTPEVIAELKGGKKLPEVKQTMVGAATVTGGGGPKRTVLRMTEKDVQSMRNRGMDEKDPEQVRSFLENKRGGR